LFLSHYDVHTPIHRAPEHVAQYAEQVAAMGAGPQPISERRGRSRARQDNAQYASMVSAIDASVGALVAELESQQLLDSTTIIFTSDNGGLCTLKNPGPTCNLPLRSGKGWLYEGGIRVPLIVWSPEIVAGQRGAVLTAPVLSTDYLPTMLQLAGLEQPAGVGEDGQSFAAALRGEAVVPTRPLAWHYPHYHGSEWTPGAAYQRDDWKLIEFYEQGDAELYNLSSDPGERVNLASQQPQQLAELRRELRDWQRQMQAVLPQPNPRWRAP
jgi:arylsulfatase A-like enzyme